MTDERSTLSDLILLLAVLVAGVLIGWMTYHEVLSWMQVLLVE